MLLRSYLNLISATACFKTVHPWFGLLHTIYYFIKFCKIVKTGTAYAESSFLVGLRLRTPVGACLQILNSWDVSSVKCQLTACTRVRWLNVQAAVRSGVHRVTGVSFRLAWMSTTAVRACFHAASTTCSVLE